VVDPRWTATAAAADLYLPVAPGSDIAFLNLLARRLIEGGHVDADFVARHAAGFEAFRDFLKGHDEAELIGQTGLKPKDIDGLVDWLGTARGFLSLYCMGLNQSTVGMLKNNALINLHLLLGQIGKPGAGPFSLTGQPNAMGGREAGLLSHQL